MASSFGTFSLLALSIISQVSPVLQGTGQRTYIFTPSLILLMHFQLKSEQSLSLIIYRVDGVPWDVKLIQLEHECYLSPPMPIQLP